MFKHCPDCRGEFQHWVTRCPDCGAALQLAGDAALPEAPRELPPARELACLERGDPRALHEIAERLQAAGISCRIDSYPPDEPIRPGARRGSGVATTFGLYVRPTDADEATRVRTQHLQRSLPEAALHDVATGAELSACPACGEPLAEAARECGACGLAFPEAGSEA
jgi:uncharacterized protein (UPF0212 family)